MGAKFYCLKYLQYVALETNGIPCIIKIFYCSYNYTIYRIWKENLEDICHGIYRERNRVKQKHNETIFNKGS